MVFSAQGQTDWGMEGNIADSSSFIGTKNAACFRLKSNNLERMRISESGNIGMGIKAPTERLDVDGNISLTGDILFRGYANPEETGTRMLTVDSGGKTSAQSFTVIKDVVYQSDCYLSLFGGGYGNATTLPSWASTLNGEKSIIYTGASCPAWVGIGTNLPKTTLEVIGNGHFSTNLFVGNTNYTENAGLYIGNSGVSNHLLFDHLILVKDKDDKKILQLDDDGILRTREVKVDELNWADYVFQPDYKLSSLKEVKTFIDENGHLPNVPSAKEIAEDGLNLGKMAKTTMEKVEELTLYLIHQQEMLDKQQSLLEEQGKLIEAQQEQLRQFVETKSKISEP